jgi:hypothetical protein
LSILLGAEEDEDWTIISPEEVPQPTTNTIQISESEEKNRIGTFFGIEIRLKAKLWRNSGIKRHFVW